MFGYCGLTDGKIQFGVPVSKTVTCHASDRQGSNSEPCACRAVSSDSSHHPVQPVCATIVLIITMKPRSAKVI